MKNKKNGFTLVEILLVVGFIALAGIGIYTIYSKVQSSSTASIEAKNISLLKAGVKNLYGGSVSYAGINNGVLNDGRITPDNMRVVPYVTSDTGINNSFGGVVNVTVMSLGGGTNNGFRISYAKVPGEICPKIVAAAEKDFEQITVSGTLIKTYGTNKIDVATLTGACATDTGTGVDILLDSI
jgi:type II secretory pathway pseudopilin PulG